MDTVNIYIMQQRVCNEIQRWCNVKSDVYVEM